MKYISFLLMIIITQDRMNGFDNNYLTINQYSILSAESSRKLVYYNEHIGYRMLG